ncbi:hypothetical protein AVEN_200715-1, partial [Araneus ventricosus]
LGSASLGAQQTPTNPIDYYTDGSKIGDQTDLWSNNTASEQWMAKQSNYNSVFQAALIAMQEAITRTRQLNLRQQYGQIVYQAFTQ